MAIDPTKAFTISEDGIAFESATGAVIGLVVYGTTTTPVGTFSSSVPTLFVGSNGSLFINTGSGVNDWSTPPNLGAGVSDHLLLSNIGTNTHAQIDTHIASVANPHSVTKAQVGLSNVDNTSDADKPISTATQTALNLKADKTITISGGTGLTGGGDLSANRTISMPNVGTAGTYGNATSYPVITTDAQGRISTVTTQTLSTAGDVVTFVQTSNLTNSSNVTFTNIAGLSLNVAAAGCYWLEYNILFSSAATSTGLSLTMVNTTANGVLAMQVIIPVGNDGQASNSVYNGQITAFSDAVTGLGIQATGTFYCATMKGIFDCTTGGSIVPAFRSEVNGSTITIRAASAALIKVLA